MIVENTFTTRRPLNINDDDIDPSSEHEPEERIGFTDMTFCLITCEASDIFRRLNYVPPTASDEELEAYGRETERITKEVTEQIQKKYITMPCGPQSSDLYQLTSMVAKFWQKKSWLCCQYPLQATRKAPRSDANREEILNTAIWILESDLNSKTDPHFLSQWRWYSRVFVQWHPLAVALVQLCLQTTGPAVEHAWEVVDRGFEFNGDQIADTRKGTLWKPIKRLHTKALAGRKQAMKGDIGAAGAVNSRPAPCQNAYAVRADAVNNNNENFLPEINFNLPMPSGDMNRMLPPPSNLSSDGMQEGYAPPAGNMSLNQQEGDAVNWIEWYEFVNSTWDPEQAVHQNGGGIWNPQFGFWTV